MTPSSPSPRLSLALLGALALAAPLAGCTQLQKAKTSGPASATVSGEGCGGYTDPVAAKAAFTRNDGHMTAVLEDASWIRLEPDPASAPKRYPEYFAGYTTVLVSLRTSAFVQPTKETYLLEDSAGARVTTKPEKYRGDTLRDFGPKHYAEFTLVFPHVLSKDVTWLRLTREGPEGGTVKWDLTR